MVGQKQNYTHEPDRTLGEGERHVTTQQKSEKKRHQIRQNEKIKRRENDTDNVKRSTTRFHPPMEARAARTTGRTPEHRAHQRELTPAKGPSTQGTMRIDQK